MTFPSFFDKAKGTGLRNPKYGSLWNSLDDFYPNVNFWDFRINYISELIFCFSSFVYTVLKYPSWIKDVKCCCNNSEHIYKISDHLYTTHKHIYEHMYMDVCICTSDREVNHNCSILITRISIYLALQTTSTAFAILGKLFATLAFGLIFGVTSEIYPTSVR